MQHSMPIGDVHTTHGYGQPLGGPITQLRDRQSELLRQLDALNPAQELGDSPTGRPDTDETVAQQHGSWVALLSVLRDELRQIEHALARATEGHYGICEDCRAEIAPRRLLAAPAATRCVTCQERSDGRGKGWGR